MTHYVMCFPLAAGRDIGRWSSGRPVSDWARAAEANGFDGVAVTDHPFPSDAWLESGGHHAFDPFVLLTAFGQVTSSIQLITDVVVAGYRNPYLLAKLVASTDYLCDGRLTLGMAAGYQELEFKALGADFHNRGQRFDELIEAMTDALTGDVVRRDGGCFPAPGNRMLPTPLQRPRPPIWIGGNSDAAMRRAVYLADGWMPFYQPKARRSISKAPSLESLSELRDRIQQARELRAEAGMEPMEFCSSVLEVGGDIDGILAGAEEYAAAGVTWIRVMLKGKTLDQSIASMEAFRSALASSRI